MNNQKLALLDVVIIRSSQSFRLSAYQKPTVKGDFVQYFYGHNNYVKTAASMDFSLRTYRIFSWSFWKSELEHITKVLKKLKLGEYSDESTKECIDNHQLTITNKE